MHTTVASGTLSRVRRGMALVDRSSIRGVTEVFPTASQSHHCSLWGNLLAFWRFRFQSLPRLGRASDLRSATWTAWGDPWGTSGVLEEVLPPRVWELEGFKWRQLNMGRRPVALQGRTGQRRAVAPLSWGSPAPSWGEGGGRPFSRLSTPPLVPSKMKVAAECCPSGAEVGTCPPHRGR